ncbi:MAG: hypothetical protein ACFCA4_15975 [Cyanophyceae cyanobacterium]
MTSPSSIASSALELLIGGALRQVGGNLANCLGQVAADLIPLKTLILSKIPDTTSTTEVEKLLIKLIEEDTDFRYALEKELKQIAQATSPVFGSQSVSGVGAIGQNLGTVNQDFRGAQFFRPPEPPKT